LTGNESNTTITISSSQLSSNQDLPIVVAQDLPELVTVPKAITTLNENTINASEYADHMQLSVAQLETVTLMLQVLNQTDGGPVPSE
jgi:hypothetical protein